MLQQVFLFFFFSCKYMKSNLNKELRREIEKGKIKIHFDSFYLSKFILRMKILN